jgi:glycosyltransferase involved in cell wall biosynthesis
MKKNLALFIPTLLRGGGAEATVSKIASLLKDHYQISIITLESGCDFNLDPSIKIFSLSKTHGSKTDYLKLFSFFSQISRLKKIINNNNIDIILSFTERPNLILSFVKKIKIPKVYCFRNYYSHHINDKTLWGLNWLRKLTFKWLAKRLRKSNDQIVTISKKAKEDLVDNFGFDPRKVEVIYNFYDLDLNSNKSLKEDPSYQNILKEDFLLSLEW